ncbi:MAG: hypothetical protein CMK07_03470 [Ponticaulis sp.]|nr:hypothetical protein [Ponticaulis sp.]
MKSLAVILMGTGACFATPAFAQNSWTGEGSFSASASTGNTETTHVGLGLKLNYETGRWEYGLNTSADYGETDGSETENRFLIAGNVDAQLRDRLFGYGQASYEADEFSGFESRIFAGVGLGYDIFDSEKTKWQIRGGPGIKIDEVRPVVTNGVVTTPGETEESFSVLGKSDFSYIFNENVSFTNATTGIYASESTQFTNTTALTASLTNTLSARVSFDVRHDTNPPEGFEATDTTTKVSLVYKLGE